jgi:hypothetical protein
LQSLDDAALKQLWVDEVRRALRERNGMHREDIGSELSLRGIRRIELPPDLQATIQQVMGSPEFQARVADGIVDRIAGLVAEKQHS